MLIHGRELWSFSENICKNYRDSFINISKSVSRKCIYWVNDSKKALEKYVQKLGLKVETNQKFGVVGMGWQFYKLELALFA